MLDLLIAHRQGRTVSVSSLCIAAAVPPTTALRHITSMIEIGLFIRVPDEQDRRRSHVSLASKTVDRLNALLGPYQR